MVLSISLPVFSSSFLLIIFFSAFFLFFFFLFRLFFSSFRFHFVYFSLSYLLIFLASCSSLFLPSSRRLARWGSSSSGQIHLQTGVVWKGKVGWWWGGEMNSDCRGQTNDANPMAASWVRLVVYYSRAFHEKEFYCICDHSLTTSSFDKSCSDRLFPVPSRVACALRWIHPKLWWQKQTQRRHGRAKRRWRLKRCSLSPIGDRFPANYSFYTAK